MDKGYSRILEKIKTGFEKVLSDELVGIYVHGSIAFGCFRSDVSDIDLIVVVRKTPDIKTKLHLIRHLLELEPYAPQKGIEMSVVLRRYCRDFVYPTPFELHYSPMYTDKCREDALAYCRYMHGTDTDLAAHFSVIESVGITLCGEDRESVFAHVPREYYLDSIKKDILSADSEIQDNPVYYTLNLCRVFAYIKTGRIMSKSAGGRWGAENLSGDFRDVILAALTAYENALPCRISEKKAKEFAKYMIKQINE